MVLGNLTGSAPSVVVYYFGWSACSGWVFLLVGSDLMYARFRFGVWGFSFLLIGLSCFFVCDCWCVAFVVFVGLYSPPLFVSWLLHILYGCLDVHFLCMFAFGCNSVETKSIGDV